MCLEMMDRFIKQLIFLIIVQKNIFYLYKIIKRFVASNIFSWMFTVFIKSNYICDNLNYFEINNQEKKSFFSFLQFVVILLSPCPFQAISNLWCVYFWFTKCWETNSNHKLREHVNNIRIWQKVIVKIHDFPNNTTSKTLEAAL